VPFHQFAPVEYKPTEEAFMVYEKYDFTRNPVVEDQVFFLESKCIRCGSSVLALSLEELLEEEKRHRVQCRLMRVT
jgi:hypothetical protein